MARAQSSVLCLWQPSLTNHGALGQVGVWFYLAHNMLLGSSVDIASSNRKVMGGLEGREVKGKFQLSLKTTFPTHWIKSRLGHVIRFGTMSSFLLELVTGGQF